MSAATVVDVALVSLDGSAALIEAALARLDGPERDAAATRGGDARRRYVIAHAAARTLVGERLGIDAVAVVIATEPSGLPVVRGISYSLAHSGERAVVAIAPAGVQLGVDLERVRARTRLDRLAARVFTAAELDAWRALEPAARPRAFTVRWTELEALLKARGTGIAGGLASAIEVPDGWSRATLDAGSEYAGAIAADQPEIVVTVRDFAFG